jgi:hypothetical protein
MIQNPSDIAFEQNAESCKIGMIILHSPSVEFALMISTSLESLSQLHYRHAKALKPQLAIPQQ